ncbi:hypothetical protein TEA_024148 [Camellia sinensis var. sinensis]|uniref:Uncharacterized protein n=1 Tax=Camellia sinensis var. sinensis TaxID=542762 RepID=A0A4S4EL79_CAMSN|nr:hypothetical protein TEA_024148 [Camellia sinensis var. sinensis]
MPNPFGLDVVARSSVAVLDPSLLALLSMGGLQKGDVKNDLLVDNIKSHISNRIHMDDDELASFVEHQNINMYVDIGEHAVIPEGISKHVHASKYLIAGAVAGTASRTATAPLDRLKVVLQVQTGPARIVPAIKNIWREGGFLGFFRGNGLNVMKVAPESAIKFYTYEMLKTIIGDIKGEQKADIGTSGRLIAGGLAGAVAQTAIYPMDLVKTRLQTFACESGKVPSLGKLSKDIWVHEGPRAFYRGVVPSLLGIIPYAGIDLAAYEALKDVSKRYILHDGEPGPFVQLGCGTISGALGATCVYPLQVIRTRLQAQRANTSSSYKGMSDVFRKTLQNEGLRGFYKGLLPNLLKVVPAAVVSLKEMMSCYAGVVFLFLVHEILQGFATGEPEVSKVAAVATHGTVLLGIYLYLILCMLASGILGHLSLGVAWHIFIGCCVLICLHVQVVGGVLGLQHCLSVVYGGGGAAVLANEQGSIRTNR